jgi:hypothetical protein
MSKQTNQVKKTSINKQIKFKDHSCECLSHLINYIYTLTNSEGVWNDSFHFTMS